MLAFLFLSLLGFVKAQSDWRWAAVGSVSLALAVGTSWEAVFVCPGLLAISLWTHDTRRIRLATAYAVVALITGAIILLNSAWHYPEQTAELWQRALFRMGSAHEYVATTVIGSRRQFPMPSARETIRTILGRHFDYVGILPLIAVAWLLTTGIGSRANRRRVDSAMVLAGLIGMWWLWIIIFRSHVYIHDCQILIAVPAAAFAAGVVGQSVVDLLDLLIPVGNWPRKMLVVVVVPFMLLLPLAHATRDSGRFVRVTDLAQSQSSEAVDDVQLGLALSRNTEAGSVVITPAESAVPLFYSQRHLIQGVAGDRDVRSAIAFARKNFPGSPLYLAIPADLAQQYLATHGDGKTIGYVSRMALVKLASQGGV
jgi:hypothetical protein